MGRSHQGCWHHVGLSCLLWVCMPCAQLRRGARHHEHDWRGQPSSAGHGRASRGVQTCRATRSRADPWLLRAGSGACFRLSRNTRTDFSVELGRGLRTEDAMHHLHVAIAAAAVLLAAGIAGRAGAGGVTPPSLDSEPLPYAYGAPHGYKLHPAYATPHDPNARLRAWNEIADSLTEALLQLRSAPSHGHSEFPSRSATRPR
jgi:hypothetical protein